MALQRIVGNEHFLTKQCESNYSSTRKPQTDSINYVPENNAHATKIMSCYSSNSLSIEYTSADGDTVSLKYESMNFQQSITALQTESDPEKIKELTQYIKDEFISIKKALFKLVSGIDDATETKSVQKKSFEIPEYWNAENTSQRIVDFAVSFYGLVNENGEEYINKIKNAIEDGFKQARDIMGDLPQEVEDLVNETFNATMSKLDTWAAVNGILEEQYVA